MSFLKNLAMITLISKNYSSSLISLSLFFFFVAASSYPGKEIALWIFAGIIWKNKRSKAKHCCFFFLFLGGWAGGLHLQHMEVPRPGVRDKNHARVVTMPGSQPTEPPGNSCPAFYPSSFVMVFGLVVKCLEFGVWPGPLLAVWTWEQLPLLGCSFLICKMGWCLDFPHRVWWELREAKWVMSLDAALFIGSAQC